MVIYKISHGWLFRYHFNPKNLFYCIENAPPYLAYYTKTTGEVLERLKDKEVEYHTLPRHIQTAVAAAQSILVETNFEENVKLHKIISQIKGD